MIHAFASVRIHGEFYIYYPDWCPNHHLYAIIMKINEKFIRCLGEKLKEIQTKAAACVYVSCISCFDVQATRERQLYL